MESDIRRWITLVEGNAGRKEISLPSHIDDENIDEVAIAPIQLSIQWDRRTAKEWIGSCQIGDRQIEIFFTRLNSFGTSSWRVDFRKEKHQPKRGTVAETISILNSVISAIKEFLESVKPDRLQMSPTNTSREKLYRSVIRRIKPQIEQTYNITEKSYGTLFGEFILSRLDDV